MFRESLCIRCKKNKLESDVHKILEILSEKKDKTTVFEVDSGLATEDGKDYDFITWRFYVQR